MSVMPADIRVHSDAAFGAAWREAERLLPLGWFLILTRRTNGEYIATAQPIVREGISRSSTDPAQALELLARAMGDL